MHDEKQRVLGQTENDFLFKSIKEGKKLKKYEGPFIAVHAESRGKTNFMARVGNETHDAQTNNGFNRKQCGGYFNH